MTNLLSHKVSAIDHDGNEIFQGDTVYVIGGNPAAFRVDYIEYRDDECWVVCGYHCFKPTDLTCKELDSLIKLRDDMNKIVQPTERAYGEFISRLTELIGKYDYIA